MSRKKKKVDQEAILRQRAFQEELRRKRLWNIFGYSAIVAGALILFLVIAGGYLPIPDFLKGIGYKNEGRGLWVDCNSAENKNKAYCLKRVRPKKRNDWKNMRKGSGGKGPAFDLF